MLFYYRRMLQEQRQTIQEFLPQEKLIPESFSQAQAPIQPLLVDDRKLTLEELGVIIPIQENHKGFFGRLKIFGRRHRVPQASPEYVPQPPRYGGSNGTQDFGV